MTPLPTRWLGREWRYFAEIDSTNRYLQDRADDLPHGSVVIANFQTAGRGRLGRGWEAPAGTSLLVSLFVKPAWAADRAPWLTMIGGLAAVEAIRETAGLETQLKWPNDIVRAGRGGLVKLGGILLEGRFQADRLASAVIGIGLNVNIAAVDLPQGVLPPSSLLVEGGRPVARPRLLAALLAHFEAWYDRSDGGASPRSAWADRLITLGKPVTVRDLDPRAAAWEGLAEGVDDYGRLLVRDRKGELRPVAAADVAVRET